MRFFMGWLGGAMASVGIISNDHLTGRPVWAAALIGGGLGILGLLAASR